MTEKTATLLVAKYVVDTPHGVPVASVILTAVTSLSETACVRRD